MEAQLGKGKEAPGRAWCQSMAGNMAQAEQQLARDVLMLPTPTTGFTRTQQIPSQPCTESCGQHSSPLGSILLGSIPSQHGGCICSSIFRE